jgi:hypothetical protein
VLRPSRFSVLRQGPLDNENGLLGRWDFDGASANDISGNQFEGTLLNAPPLIDAFPGMAYNFNGSSQAVSLPNRAPLRDVAGNVPASLCAWVNLTTTQDGIILGKFGPGRECFHLRSNRGVSNKIEIRIVVNAVTPYFAESTTLCSNITGKWTHVVGTADGANVNIYINGVFEAQTAYTPGNTDAVNFGIGKDIQNNGTYLNGAVTDPRIYNRALSAAEVNALYNQGIARLSLSPDEGEMAALVIFQVFLRPDADSIDGGWTNELGGTELFASIDESVASDTDYIQSSINPVSDVAKISLSDPSTAVTTPVKIRYRYKKSEAAATNLTVRLLQGAVEIAAWTHTDISASFVTTEQTLTAPQFASITNFNDLYIEFTAYS